jgi:hypothetical protein
MAGKVGSVGDGEPKVDWSRKLVEDGLINDEQREERNDLKRGIQNLKGRDTFGKRQPRQRSYKV